MPRARDHWIQPTAALKMQHKRSFLFIFLIISCVIALSLISCGEDSPQGPDPIETDPDTIPPATVTELVARTPTASTIVLVWFAPGDDGSSGQASMYDIRYSHALITEQNWDSATQVSGVPSPKPADQLETVIVKGLQSDTRIYFALKSYDEVPNESGLSNNATETTLQEFSPPATIRDLRAKAVTDTDFLLTWTSPGDDWMDGTASEYDIRYHRFPITDQNWSTISQVTGEPAPKPAGSPDSCTVCDLEPNINYYFAMKAWDDAGNQSAMSNLSPALAFNEFLLVSPLRPNIGEDVTIVFKSSPDEITTIHIWRRYYIAYQGYTWTLFRHLVEEQYDGGSQTVIWDTTNDDGETLPNNWSMQYKMNLFWGDARVDSMDFQVLQ
jgi:hypothetical protein